jgi:hypothetical protein
MRQQRVPAPKTYAPIQILFRVPPIRSLTATVKDRAAGVVVDAPRRMRPYADGIYIL